MQSLLANIFASLHPTYMVILLHTSEESRNDCFDKYGINNPKATKVEG